MAYNQILQGTFWIWFWLWYHSKPKLKTDDWEALCILVWIWGPFGDTYLWSFLIRVNILRLKECCDSRFSSKSQDADLRRKAVIRYRVPWLRFPTTKYQRINCIISSKLVREPSRQEYQPERLSDPSILLTESHNRNQQSLSNHSIQSEHYHFWCLYESAVSHAEIWDLAISASEYMRSSINLVFLMLSLLRRSAKSMNLSSCAR